MLAEILVIPGIGVAGILGIILLVLAIYFAYSLNTVTGNWVLTGSILSSTALLILSLRAKTWEKVSLKTNVTGKSKSNFLTENFKIGDKGLTTSRLTPIGNAKINGNIVEVSARTEFIETNTEIEIVKIEKSKITVKQI